jgi:NADH-quinone oxidoreductase subunit I
MITPGKPRIDSNPLLDNCAGEKQTTRMRKLLERLFQVDFLKGLTVTFRAQNPKNIVTEQYPLERPMVAERYRGAPRLNNNPETGETLCIGCNLCALACPENLIVVGWERDDATRRKVLTTFTYDTSRCMFCGLCEDACPTDALELTQDFEMAYFTREGAIWDRHRLEQGPTPARYTR